MRYPRVFRWNRSSAVLLSGFLFIVGLIVYVWWPLAEQVLGTIDWRGPWWLYMDWLLIGIFLFMSVTIVVGADLRRDALIIFVATIGGLVIEAWGTQTNLWSYYTNERPPLWIVPAWPIATLSIDRITRLLLFFSARVPMTHEAAHDAASFPSIGHVSTGVPAPSSPDRSFYRILYWCVFAAFLAIMVPFVAPTLNKPYTVLALLFCVLLIVTPLDHRHTLMVFAAGAGLGYSLELWGTTRECWTYYTLQTPPLFAVLAHGMAAVAFWRTGLLLRSTMMYVLAARTGMRLPD